MAAKAAVAACAAAALLALSACSSGSAPTTRANGDGAASAATERAEAVEEKWDESEEIAISLKGSSATSASNAVKIDGSTVTIGAAGAYRLKGSLTDGQIVVQSPGDGLVRSYEGLESTALVIAGGDVQVVASDDGINAAGGVDGSGLATPGGAARDTFGANARTLTISGGHIVVDAGGDGLDVNGSATMTNGTVIVNGPTARNNAAVDYDGTFNISGGVLVAAGSSGMAMAPSASSAQGSLLSTFTTQVAGTLVHIKSTDGASVLTFAPSKAFQSIAVSSPALTASATYQVLVGGAAGGAQTFGLYEATEYSGGTLVATTTTSAARSSGMFGPAR